MMRSNVLSGRFNCKIPGRILDRTFTSHAHGCTALFCESKKECCFKMDVLTAARISHLVARTPCHIRSETLAFVSAFRNSKSAG